MLYRGQSLPKVSIQVSIANSNEANGIIRTRTVEAFVPNADDPIATPITDDTLMDGRSGRRGCGSAVSTGTSRRGHWADRQERRNGLGPRRRFGGTSPAGTLVHDVAFTKTASMLRSVAIDAPSTL